jgi:DNA-binding NtrC family response regulator
MKGVKRLLCIASTGWDGVALHAGELPGWDVCAVATLDEARRVLDTQTFRVGLLIDAFDIIPHDALSEFLQRYFEMEWIGVLAPSMLDQPDIGILISDHLSDFHSWPVDRVRLAHALGHAHGRALLRARYGHARALAAPAATLIVGDSAPICALRANIAKVARVPAPVLIWGETGSGKELAAQAIHAQSARAGGPFIAVNCGAIPAGLVQSELFGHERGAFTGAARERRGVIEAAAGGTLFLDEIGDLPRDMQVNLLRFLQEGTFTRVGGTRSLVADVRVVAASHVDLNAAVAQGLFRADLYYRLSVLPVRVPALREYKEGLPALAAHVFARYAPDKAQHVKGLSGAALQALAGHDWPGNVRELINRIRRAMVLSEHAWITAEDLGLGAPVRGDPLAVARANAERHAISASLQRLGNNVTLAARELDVSRMTLYRLIAKHGIAL